MRWSSGFLACRRGRLAGRLAGWLLGWLAESKKGGAWGAGCWPRHKWLSHCLSCLAHALPCSVKREASRKRPAPGCPLCSSCLQQPDHLARLQSGQECGNSLALPTVKRKAASFPWALEPLCSPLHEVTSSCLPFSLSKKSSLQRESQKWSRWHPGPSLLNKARKWQPSQGGARHKCHNVKPAFLELCAPQSARARSAR